MLYSVVHNMVYNIVYITQVEEVEKKLKHKLRPYNAFLKAKGLDYPAACPREELHQFLIGLYGDYIIPSTLYEYHKVLRSPDLVTSRPGAAITQNLVSNDMLAGVWARLRDRLSSVDGSSSMVQVTQDYATHFYDMYIDKHSGKHLTGDRVRILLLLLPFLLRDLIAPEVNMRNITCYILWYISCDVTCISQVAFINNKIRTALPGSPLHGKAPVKDPSDALIEVHLAALKWNIQQRRFGLVADDCEKLQEMSIELLELLKSNMPEKTGEASGWNFEKAHSILHKVRV